MGHSYLKEIASHQSSDLTQDAQLVLTNHSIHLAQLLPQPDIDTELHNQLQSVVFTVFKIGGVGSSTK